MNGGILSGLSIAEGSAFARRLQHGAVGGVAAKSAVTLTKGFGERARCPLVGATWDNFRDPAWIRN